MMLVPVGFKPQVLNLAIQYSCISEWKEEVQECIKCKFEWSLCVLLDRRHWQHDPDQLELVTKNEICQYVICKLIEH